MLGVKYIVNRLVAVLGLPRGGLLALMMMVMMNDVDQVLRPRSHVSYWVGWFVFLKNMRRSNAVGNNVRSNV